MRKLYDWKETAILVSASFKDFDGDLAKWQGSFYTVWRYQMTWGFAHRINLEDTRNGVKLVMLVKPSFMESLVSTMGDLGYQNIITEDVSIGVIDSTAHDGLEDIWDIILD